MGASREITERAYAALAAFDTDGFLALCAPDCEFDEAGTHLRGHEQIRAFIGAYLTAMPDIRVEVRTLVEEGERVATETRFTGTHEGPLQTPAGPIPATHKPVDLTTADFVTIRGGQIAAWHVYMDTAEFMRQLGLAPGSEGAPQAAAPAG